MKKCENEKKCSDRRLTHAGYPICDKLQFLMNGTGRNGDQSNTIRNVEVSPNLEDISIK